jgi:hypothetical protein
MKLTSTNYNLMRLSLASSAQKKLYYRSLEVVSTSFKLPGRIGKLKISYLYEAVRHMPT